MRKPLPTQEEIFRWMSFFYIEKLNQSTQNKDWAKATAILSIINVIAECLEELEAKC